MRTPMDVHVPSLYIQSDTDLLLSNGDTPYDLKLRDLPADKKPREKLVKYGPANLSVSELLALVLITGTTKEDVLQMSARLLKEYGEQVILSEKDPRKLEEALDIPLVKACQIVACLELGRRFYKAPGIKLVFVRTAKEVYQYLAPMRSLPKEHLRGLYLDNHYRLIHDEVISIGSLTANIIHPREVFKTALEHSASAIILAHNHPSGVAKPSSADIAVTEQLVQAGKILGIHLLDHVIVTKHGFASVPVNYN